jgi:hypothetical protein
VGEVVNFTLTFGGVVAQIIDNLIVLFYHAFQVIQRRDIICSQHALHEFMMQLHELAKVYGEHYYQIIRGSPVKSAAFGKQLKENAPLEYVVW